MGMNMESKLNFDVLGRLRVSKEFIDFIIRLSQLQDRTRRCSGLYYREIAKDIGVCYQTFYNHLRHAETLGIIKIYWEHMTTKDGDWDVRFLEGESNRYLNVNVDFLFTDAFRELKLNTKMIVLNVLGLKQIRDGERQILSFKRLSEYAGTDNINLLMEYIEALKSFFNIEIYDDYIIMSLLEQYKQPRTAASMLFAVHLVSYLCRRHKVILGGEDVDDIIKSAEIYCMYRERYAELFIITLVKALKRHRVLQGEYIHNKFIEAMAAQKQH